MMYKICYWTMLASYLGLSMLSPDIKSKAIGILLVIVNALIFWR